MLATGGDDETVCIWSTQSHDGQCECIGILKGHEKYITSICVEETFILTGSADATIRKWDMLTCECIHTYRGHNGPVNRILCTGDFVFSGSHDKTARCWDFDSGECIRVFQGHKLSIFPLIFIPGDEDNENSNSLNWNVNSDFLITGSADCTARIWSFETGKSLFTLRGHSGIVICMSADSNGKHVFTGSDDQTIRSWKIETGECLKIFQDHRGTIVSLLVSYIMFSLKCETLTLSMVIYLL